MTERARRDLAGKMAGDVVLSDDPGATIRKWRTDFDVSQTALADELDVSASVVSDYESGRRRSPGIAVVRRVIEALLDIDEARGGNHLRQYARVLSAGFKGDIVRDLREYPTPLAIGEFYDAIGATEVVAGSGTSVAGHTVINSIEAITRLSSEEFYRLYGQSTNRALVFTGITHGEGALVALRVVTPTPSAVVLHGLDSEGLWEHAPTLARADGFSLAVAEGDLETMLETMGGLP
jgi:putative transcriptional regulator